VDEYRNEAEARKFVASINRQVTRTWTIMEVCGGQTHTLMRYGIDRMLPAKVTLVHGPGCPVCVTPRGLIDKAIALAGRPEVTLTSFGDMLRVPGSELDLLTVKARGGDVRVVYSPLDSVRLAVSHPQRQVVFFAVGFETTAPATAGAIWEARRLELRNFSVLNAHVRVPPAMEAILDSPGNRVQAFLAAGHVCAVMGYREYESISEKHKVPIVVTGFEPLDLLHGIHMALTALEEGRWGVENQYSRAVTRPGNLAAQELMGKVFEPASRQWRGIGPIPRSGLRLRPGMAELDAESRFDLSEMETDEPAMCIAGEVLQGRSKPSDCTQFGSRCTPVTPLGAPMVSAEGACAAYYQYGRAT
jgi:hydrogenase expression/formation protein HypD